MKVTGLATFANAPRICGTLIAAGMATMSELKGSLTLEEAYQLMEILEVKNYHSWLASQQQEKENG